MSRARLWMLLALVVLAVPVTAAADDGGGGGDGDDDVRVAASCTRGAEASLRLREREGDRLRLDFELRDRRRTGRWLVVVVHERRLAFRGRLSTGGSLGALSLRKTLHDLFGEDTVLVRAAGPRRASCRATATLPDS